MVKCMDLKTSLYFFSLYSMKTKTKSSRMRSLLLKKTFIKTFVAEVMTIVESFKNSVKSEPMTFRHFEVNVNGMEMLFLSWITFFRHI